MKKIKNCISIFLAILMVAGVFPLASFAAPASDIPDEMLDNVFLDALAYTGYDVQATKDSGQIFKKYGSSVASGVLSNIGYDSSFANEGTETITKSGTVTGKAPNISRFETYGLCCASYCSYVYFNYLPNIEGIDTSGYIRPTNLKSSGAWSTAADKWVSQGKAREIEFTQSSDGKTFTAKEEIPIGSLIVFTASGTVSHVGLYAGKYNGKNFITHVGNSRGPEIIALEGLMKNGAAELVSSVIVPPFVEEKGYIEVYKKDTNGNALSGAVFVATNKDTGEQYKIGPTSSKGYAATEKVLPFGTYTVKETVFPTNYQASGQTEWTVTLNSNNKGVITINAVNEQIPGKVQIIKTSEDGKIEGISFRITGNGVDKTVKTESNGKVTISTLKPGTYTVTETVADKYEPQESMTVTVVSNKTATVTFNNTLKRGDLKVTKTSEDGLVEGVEFKLSGTSISGDTVQQFAVTDSKGIASFTDVLIGNNYVLEENNTADRYIVPSSQKATIEWNKVTEKSFYNELKRGDLTVTKTSEDGLVEGMKFRLYGTSFSGATVNEYATTNAKGIATFKDILIGENYTLEEVGTPDRYIVPDNQNVVISWNEVTVTACHNELKKGDLKVTKNSEDGLVEGVKFHLYGTSYLGIKVDEYATTDENGVASFNDILIGTNYTLEEVNTAIRYVIPSVQKADIKWDEVTNKSFKNILKKFNVTVTKTDVETGESQGDATLEGAVYGIYKSGELVDTYTTDKNGQLTTKYYICDSDWTLKEIKASEGYLIDNTVHKIGAEPKNFTVELNTLSMGVTEKVIKGQIALIKHSDNGDTQIETPEAGAEFQVYLKSLGSYEQAREREKDLLVCDEFGFAQTKSLPYGIYTVHQTKGKNGREFMADFDVVINTNGQVYRYLINNAYFESYIKVVKTDAESGMTIPYAGAAFQIYDTDGKLVTMKYTYPTPTTIDTFYTDANGCLVTPEKLPHGKGYTLVEVAAPYGYVIDSTPITFNVTRDDSSRENDITIITVEKKNMAQKGTITISKSGEVFSTVTEEYGIYQPHYEVQNLKGATFTVTAAEDIYTPDGTLRYSKGTVVSTIATDETGKATTEPIYLGKYEIRETEAPYGYVLNDEVINVELVYAGQEIELTSIEADAYNERQKVKISLSKVLETDENFRVGMNGEILSVKFALYAQEDIVANDGTFIPKDAMIEIAACDENGKITFTTDVPVGSKLYVKEIATHDSYILSDEAFEVSFEYAGQDVAIVEVALNDGNPVANNLIRGSVLVTKVDSVTKENTLSGAVFEVYLDVDKDKKFNPEVDIFVGEFSEFENGTYGMDNLCYGGYFIYEKVAPEGYEKDNAYHYFEITDNEYVVTFDIPNTLVPIIPEPEIPHTDAGVRLSMWIALTTIMLGGIIAYIIVMVRNKKEDDEE